MSNVKVNEMSAGYTRTTVAVLGKSSELAIQTRSLDVKPLHVFLVLLGGTDITLDKLQGLDSPEDPTIVWHVLREINKSPVSLARAAKDAIDQLNKTLHVPTIQVTSPHLDHKRSRSRLGAHWLGRRRKQESRTPSPPANDRHTSSHQTRDNTSNDPGPSETLIEVIRRADRIKEQAKDEFLGPYHLILSLTEDPSIVKLMQSQEIDLNMFVGLVKERKGIKITNAEDDIFPFLSKYATDMTALAREGKLNEIIGRDEEIRRVIQVLCRRTKNSAVLLGEPGVGKTAVAEGIAHRIASNQVPEHLKGTIFNLDLGALFAGAGKGEYEARVKGVIDDVMRSQEGANPAILFIDELHLITVGKSPGGQSSGMDAANLLKPALARGQFRCIGATTLAEYREHIEKDGALERRFATVMVNEPTVPEATTILRGIRDNYERHHKVWIMDQAIVTAVNLAHRYLTSRRLPDSAVDLMDEACASARVSQDLKPEAIDGVEQGIIQLNTRIAALERDNHPSDESALEEAKNEKASLESQRRQLERQQGYVKQWWEQIKRQRKDIQDLQKEKRDLIAAQPRGFLNGVDSKIAGINKRLADLRNGLVTIEQKGPTKVELPASLSGPGRFFFTSTAPDVITPESVAAVVERATKIPVQRLLASDKNRLLNLQESLAKQVVGQTEAVKAVTSAVQLSRTGLSNANRPIASFLFTGPSGTGKTLLSKALAKELFGQETSMVRIDGSEYSQGHSISRLIGSPPGYVGYDQGGQLTEYVRRTPYCIVLLDEIEKTCIEFLTLFLQVLDEGRLTDGQGRLIDFRNCVIIMTSNVGAELLSKVDSEQDEIPDKTRNDVMELFKKRAQFPVEFMNRIDEIIMFRTISEGMMYRILEKHLKDLQQREGLKRLRLDLEDSAKKWLVGNGISREYGARPLARVIQRELLNPLSQRLLEETIREGDTQVFIRLNDSHDGLYVRPNHQPISE